MIEATRRIRIEIPSARPGGIADVLDDGTGEPLDCRRFSLHADYEAGVSLVMELIDARASVVGTWECKKVKEEPLR